MLKFPRIAAALQRAGGHVRDLPHLPLRLADAMRDRERTDKLTTYLPRSVRRQVTREIREHASDAILCGALAEVAVVNAVSPLFVVQQRLRSRLIYDLRSVNAALTGDPHFSMESLYDIPTIAAGCRVGGKLDLRSAYWQYPVAPDLSAFMGVDLGDDRHLAWTTLPFGLDVAPRTWTELLRPFVAAWRRRGIRIIAYLDDIAIFARNTDEYAAHVNVVVRDLADAGIRISAKKAFTAPFERFEFLGLLVDLRGNGAFSISSERAATIASEAAGIVADPSSADAHRLAAFLGRTTFASAACPWLRFYQSELVACLTAAAPTGLPSRGLHDPPIPVPWSAAAFDELEWWSRHATPLLTASWPWQVLATTKSFFSRGAPQPPSCPSATAASDASATGVGLQFPVVDESGTLLAWDRIEAEPLPPWLPPSSPSAARELYGLARLLESGAIRVRPGFSVRLITDSMAAAWSWAGASSTPATARAARRLFAASLAVGAPVIVDWRPRELLTNADMGSRMSERDASNAVPPLPWVRSVLRRSFGVDHADVELFANASNRLFPSAQHGSRIPDPSASLGSGLDPVGWLSATSGWAFPPFALTRLVVARMLSGPTAARVAVLLPDCPLLALLSHRYELVPGPDYLLAPPEFARRMPPPRRLVLCLPRPTSSSAPHPTDPVSSVSATSARSAHPPTPSLLPAPAPPPAVSSTHPPHPPAPTPLPAPAPSPALPPPPSPSHRAPRPPPPAPDRAAGNMSSWSEVAGDALSSPTGYAHIAHCGSARAELGAGFALQVRNLMSSSELSDVRRRAASHARPPDGVNPGVVLSPRGADTHFALLVTKASALPQHLPTEDDVVQAFAITLDALRDSPVRRIHMPRIGCGLDRLRWDRLAPRLREVVAAHACTFHITVFH